MEEIKIEKTDLLVAYRSATQQQKEILEKLYGKEIFAIDWHEITSYEKACEVLGIEPIVFKKVGNRPEYVKMANAAYQLLVICEAINGNDRWHNEDGIAYYPAFELYTVQDMQSIDETACELSNVRKVFASSYMNISEDDGVQCTGVFYRTNWTYLNDGFHMCLNSEEKPTLQANSSLNCAVSAMV